MNSQPEPIPNYVEWTGRVPDIAVAPSRDVRETLVEVIDAEGPIQQGVIVKRWLDAAPASVDLSATLLRVRLKDALQELEDDGELVSEFERAGDAFCRVYRLPDAPTVRVRHRGSRTPFEIPLSELSRLWKLVALDGETDDAIVERLTSMLGFTYLVENARNRIVDAGRRFDTEEAVHATSDVIAVDGPVGAAVPAVSMAQTFASASAAQVVHTPGGFGERRELLLDALERLDLGERVADAPDGWLEYQICHGRRLRARLGFTRLQIAFWIDDGPGNDAANRAEAAALFEMLIPAADWRSMSTASPAHRGAGVELSVSLAADRTASLETWMEEIDRRIGVVASQIAAVLAGWRARNDRPVPVEAVPRVPPALALLRYNAQEIDDMGARAVVDQILTIFGGAARTFIRSRFGIDTNDPSAQLAQLRAAKRDRELDDVLDDEQQSAIFTLTRARNQWAHHGSMSRLGAIRAADAACLLLAAIAPKHVGPLVQARYGLMSAQAYSAALQYVKAGARAPD